MIIFFHNLVSRTGNAGKKDFQWNPTTQGVKFTFRPLKKQVNQLFWGTHEFDNRDEFTFRSSCCFKTVETPIRERNWSFSMYFFSKSKTFPIVIPVKAVKPGKCGGHWVWNNLFFQNITFELSKRSQFQRKAQNHLVLYPIVLHQQKLIHCHHDARYQLKDQQNLDLEDRKSVENYSSSQSIAITTQRTESRINDIDDWWRQKCWFSFWWKKSVCSYTKLWVRISKQNVIEILRALQDYHESHANNGKDCFWLTNPLQVDNIGLRPWWETFCCSNGEKEN